MKKQHTLAFYTLGCKLNYSETAAISNQLQAGGYAIADFRAHADTYVINSCTVTSNAEKRCRELIRKARRINPKARVIIMGCYAQINPEELCSLPGVSMVLGSKEKFDLSRHLEETAATEPAAIPAKEAPDNFVQTFSSGDRTRSFFKIQDGCDYLCAYCTIPRARGRSRSNTIRETLETARQIAGTTMKEVVLTGVNIGDFGKPHGESFFGLLQELVRIEGLERIRLSSVEPDLLSDDIIELVAAEPRLMPHFHMPLQSGSNAILKAMGRRYDTARFADRVARIRTYLPHACIAADVITGFPGESDDLFRESLDFITDMAISYMHVFTYSERENTRASSMADRIPADVSRQRSTKLQALSKAKKDAFILSNQGRQEKVLWEKEKLKDHMYGFTENYVRVKTTYDTNRVNTIETVVLNKMDDHLVFII